MALYSGYNPLRRCKDSDGLEARLVSSLHASLDAQRLVSQLSPRGHLSNVDRGTRALRGCAVLPADLHQCMATVGSQSRVLTRFSSRSTAAVMMKRERSERALGGAGKGVKAEAGVKHSPCDQSRAPLYKSGDKREKNRERVVEVALFGFLPATSSCFRGSQIGVKGLRSFVLARLCASSPNQRWSGTLALPLPRRSQQTQALRPQLQLAR